MKHSICNVPRPFLRRARGISLGHTPYMASGAGGVTVRKGILQNTDVDI